MHVNLFTKDDTILQMASCSFDVHVQEMIGALTVGATSIMLHRDGNWELEYVTKVLEKKQVSYMQSVPAYINNLVDFLKGCDCTSFGSLRTLDIGGKHMDSVSDKNFLHYL